MNSTDQDISLITYDIDWAPDWVISHVLELLRSHQVKATFFATHETDLNSEIQNDPLFELGIHPNFLPNSSHGKTSQEVLEYCLKLVPNALSSRSHSLATNERTLQLMCEDFGIKNDGSIFLPDTPRVYPHEICYSERQIKLIRWPHFFQDNMFMFKEDKTWHLNDPYFKKEGLKIYNFHPTNVVLNSQSFKDYTHLKESKGLSNFKPQDKDYFRNQNSGVETLLMELLSSLKSNPTHCLSDLNP